MDEEENQAARDQLEALAAEGAARQRSKQEKARAEEQQKKSQLAGYWERRDKRAKELRTWTALRSTTLLTDVATAGIAATVLGAFVLPASAAMPGWVIPAWIALAGTTVALLLGVALFRYLDIRFRAS